LPPDSKVIEIKGDVEAEPRLLNSDPYEKGWLHEIRIYNTIQVDCLLRVEAYSQLV